MKAAKYPPLGERGFATALPHFQYRSLPAKEGYAALNDATMVIVQFESAEGVDNAEAIFAVEGVDMALFGTNDLTADMGIPGDYDNPRVRDAYARAIAAAKKHGKHVGVGGLASQPEAHRRVRQDGRALCLDRHRSRVSAVGRNRKCQAGAGAGGLAPRWHAPCFPAKLSGQKPRRGLPCTNCF